MLFLKQLVGKHLLLTLLLEDFLFVSSRLLVNVLHNDDTATVMCSVRMCKNSLAVSICLSKSKSNYVSVFFFEKYNFEFTFFREQNTVCTTGVHKLQEHMRRFAVLSCIYNYIMKNPFIHCFSIHYT